MSSRSCNLTLVSLIRLTNFGVVMGGWEGRVKGCVGGGGVLRRDRVMCMCRGVAGGAGGVK